MIWLVFILLVAIPADKLANHLVLLFLLKIKKFRSSEIEDISGMIKICFKRRREISIGYWIYCVMTLPLSVIIIPLAIVGKLLIRGTELDGN